MKSHVFVQTAVTIFLTVGCLAEAPAIRSWKDVTGRVIQAEFVSADSTTVKLRMNGKEYPLALEKLSLEDREWIKQQMAAPTPPAAPSPASAPEAMTIGGVPVTPGVKMEFETPMSETLTAKLTKRLGKMNDTYSDIDMTKAQVGLFVPANFDPSKSWPIMIVSVTDSGRDKGKFPSSVKAMGAFLDAAKDLGWVVLAADCPGNLTPGLPYNRCALVEAGIEAMATAWPGSKDWPVATGGFSGGAKYSGWLGGWFSEAGRQVIGMFMGGCNQDMATLAIEELKPPKKSFTQARVFVSTGKNDNIAGPTKTGSVIKALKGAGFETQEELHEGGHEVNKDHVLAAMKWFVEASK